MKPLKITLIITLILVGLVGCKLTNPSIMLKTPKDYVYDTFPNPPDTQYVISKDDVIKLRLMANDGIKLIDIIGSQNTTSSNSTSSGTDGGEEFTVEYDGTVKLPVLGRLKIAGLTQRRAEDTLEMLYSAVYTKPFVQLSVVNRRVIVFTGGMGAAKVIPLVNQNITLFEALALAGGIDPDGKAYRIKLIRGSLKKPYVFLIDASRLEKIQEADLILQADDIIYVEPLVRPARVFRTEVFPWISMAIGTLGLALTIYTVTRLK